MISIKTCSTRIIVVQSWYCQVRFTPGSQFPSILNFCEPLDRSISKCLRERVSIWRPIEGEREKGRVEKKKKERDWFRGTTTGPSVSPPPGRPWNQLTNRGRSGNSIVRNKGKGLRNASKYHDIGTPIVGHPATSSGFLFVSTNSWRGRGRTKRRKTKRNGE